MHLGIGLGFSELRVDTSDSVIGGRKETFNFAYQVGTGLGYQLTDRVNLAVGYRFFQPGSTSLSLLGSAGEDRGSFRLEVDSHEVTLSLRILLYDLPYPWR